MSSPVRILPRAQHDFTCIFAYIEARSPQGAEHWKQAFKDGISRVQDNPGQFGVAPENESTEFELRQLPFRTAKGHRYRAVFTVLDGDVLILRIRGPGQPSLRPDEMPLD